MMLNNPPPHTPPNRNNELASIFKTLSKQIRLFNKSYLQNSEPLHIHQHSLKIDQNLSRLETLNHRPKELQRIKPKWLSENTPHPPNPSNPPFQTSIVQQIHKSQVRVNKRFRLNQTNHPHPLLDPSSKTSTTNLQDTFNSTLFRSISKRVDSISTKSIPKLKIKKFFIKKQNIKSVVESKIKLKEIIREFRKHPHSLTLDHFHTFYSVKKKYLDDLIGTPSPKMFKRQISTDRVRSKHEVKVDPLQRMGTDIQYVLSECSNVLESHYINLDKPNPISKLKRRRRDTPNVLERLEGLQPPPTQVPDTQPLKSKLKLKLKHIIFRTVGETQQDSGY